MNYKGFGTILSGALPRECRIQARLNRIKARPVHEDGGKHTLVSESPTSSVEKVWPLSGRVGLYISYGRSVNKAL